MYVRKTSELDFLLSCISRLIVTIVFHLSPFFLNGEAEAQGHSRLGSESRADILFSLGLQQPWGRGKYDRGRGW